MWCSCLQIILRTYSSLTILITEGNRVFHVSILYLVSLGSIYVSGHISYGQASTYHPRHTYYITVVVFVCLYVRTTLAETAQDNNGKYSVALQVIDRSKIITYQELCVYPEKEFILYIWYWSMAYNCVMDRTNGNLFNQVFQHIIKVRSGQNILQGMPYV